MYIHAGATIIITIIIRMRIRIITMFFNSTETIIGIDNVFVEEGVVGPVL